MPENPSCGFSVGMEPVFEVDRISAIVSCFINILRAT